jgi:hypothetical protein
MDRNMDTVDFETFYWLTRIAFTIMHAVYKWLWYNIPKHVSTTTLNTKEGDWLSHVTT